MTGQCPEVFDGKQCALAQGHPGSHQSLSETVPAAPDSRTSIIAAPDSPATLTPARCAETQSGLRCILVAGHTEPHTTGWQASGAAPTVASGPMWTAPAGTNAKRRGVSQRQLVVGLVVIVGIAIAINLGRGGLTRSTTGAPAAAPAAWTPPSGFTLTTDPTVAYRWLKAGEFHCVVADSCWGMNVVSRDGCPHSLYVELSVLNNAGTVVGYTNDVAGVLGPGQQAQLVFESVDDGAAKASVTKVSCY